MYLNRELARRIPATDATRVGAPRTHARFTRIAWSGVTVTYADGSKGTMARKRTRNAQRTVSLDRIKAHRITAADLAPIGGQYD